MDITNQRRIQELLTFLPKFITALALTLGVGDQGSDELQDVFFGVYV